VHCCPAVHCNLKGETRKPARLQGQRRIRIETHTGLIELFDLITYVDAQVRN
jgi:hypothetical protein